MLEFCKFVQKNSTTRLNANIRLQTLIEILTPPLQMVALLVPPLPSIELEVIKSYYNYARS
jgi:hypothetical protein